MSLWFLVAWYAARTSASGRICDIERLEIVIKLLFVYVCVCARALVSSARCLHAFNATMSYSKSQM